MNIVHPLFHKGGDKVFQNGCNGGDGNFLLEIRDEEAKNWGGGGGGGGV